jgi:hypothetical protein
MGKFTNKQHQTLVWPLFAFLMSSTCKFTMMPYMKKFDILFVSISGMLTTIGINVYIFNAGNDDINYLIINNVW